MMQQDESMRWHRRVLAAVGLMAGLLATNGAAHAAGIGVSLSPQDARRWESSRDSCRIISDEVAAKVLGVPIVRREPTSEPSSGTFGCIKGTVRGNDMTHAYSVSASVMPGAAAYLSHMTGEQKTMAVAGLGDSAVFWVGGGTLLIAAGADLIFVQVMKAGVWSTQESAIAVAKDVLGRR